MSHKFIRYGLIAAGLTNIGGVLLFSRGLTNTAINNADPIVMSNFGFLMVIVWGLACLGAATVTFNIK
jgi:ABC-type transport system involved in multi-copper enzyme maturation permease subunit